MKVAVVPARGGSKRIPRKNIRSFLGRPIISWVLDELLASGVFDMVIVSTDDREIAEIAVSEGATVPFFRPAELADDHTTTGKVVDHAVDELRKIYPREDLTVCTVYPTAVFSDRHDYARSLEIYETIDDGFVFAVGTFPAPIERSLVFEDLTCVRFSAGASLTRSQDLPRRYYDAGQFYWASQEMWRRWESGNLRPCMPYVLPKWKVHDIDDEDDWEFAELVFRHTREVDPHGKSRG